MSGANKSTGCPHEEVRPVSKSDPSLGDMGICKKFQGRCAYFNNPDEFKKIENKYENCPIYKTLS